MQLIGYGHVNLTPGPTGINLDGNLANPNAIANASIGNLTPTGGTFPYSWLLSGTSHLALSGNVGNLVVLRVAPTGVGNLTPGGTETCTVAVTDTHGASFTQGFSVNVATVPVSVTLSPNTIVETAATGTLVGSFNTNGGVPNDTYSNWTNPKFQISGTGLILSSAGHGNITGNTTEVGNVTSTDSFGNSVTQGNVSVTIQTTALFQQPSLSLVVNPSDSFDVLWTGGGSPYVAPVSEGGNASWTIANATGNMSSLNGSTYTLLDNIQTAAIALGSFTGRLPGGMYRHKGISPAVGLSRTASWVGQGWNDHGNVVYTHLSGTTTGIDHFHVREVVGSTFTYTLQFYVRNMTLGPFPFEYAPQAASFTGNITSTTLTVTAVGIGNVTTNMEIDDVSGHLISGTYVVGPKKGNMTGSIAANTLTVTGVNSGSVLVGQAVTGNSVLANTTVTALGTGTGGNGTYTVSQNHVVPVPSETLLFTFTGGPGIYVVTPSQTVASETMTGNYSGVFFGTTALNMFSCKLTVFDHVQFKRIAQNGCQVSDSDPWNQMANMQAWFFDCEGWGCGNDGLHHNFYMHNIRMWLERCYSHDSSGHAFKADAQLCAGIDNTWAGRTDPTMPGPYGVGNPCLNMTSDQDANWDRTLFQSTLTKSVTLAVQESTRNETAGVGIQLKFPPYWKKSLTNGRLIPWFYGGYGNGPSIQTGARVTNAVTAGNNRVDLVNVAALCAQVSGQFSRNLTDQGPHGYDFQGVLDNGAQHQCSATYVTNGNATLTLDLDTNIPVGRTMLKNAPVQVKQNGNATGSPGWPGLQPWDYIVRDISTRDFWDPTSSTYYWAQVVGANGKMDLTQSNRSDGRGFYVKTMNHSHEEPIWTQSPNITLFSQPRDNGIISFVNDTSVQMNFPMPPGDSSDGSWPHTAGNGNATFNNLMGSPPIMGTNGNFTVGSVGGMGGSDFRRTNWSIYANFSYYDQHTTFPVKFQFITAAGFNSPPISNDFGTSDLYYVDAGGNLATGNFNNGAKPVAQHAQFTITGNISAGTGNVTIPVSATTGILSGDLIQTRGVDVHNLWPRYYGGVVTNVGAGNITITPNVTDGNVSVASGARATAIPNTVSLPAGILPASQYPWAKPT